MKKLDVSKIVAIALGVLLVGGLVAGLAIGIRNAIRDLNISEGLADAAQSGLTTKAPQTTFSVTPPPEPAASPSATPADWEALLSQIVQGFGDIAIGQEYWYGENYQGFADRGSSFAFSADGVDEIRVDVRMGAVRLRTSQDGKIHIAYNAYLNENLAGRHTFDCTQEGDVLTFSQDFGKSLDTETGSRIVLTVSLPENFPGRVEMRASSGLMDAEGCAMDALDVSLTDGAISVDGVRVENASLALTNGDIRVGSAYGLMWEMRAIHGNIRADALDVLSFSAATTAGDVDVGCSMTAPTGSLSTGYGNVTLRAPVGASFAFQMETYWGSLEFDGALEPSFGSRSTWKASGSCGGGRNEVKLFTVSGDVRVSAMEP